MIPLRKLHLLLPSQWVRRLISGTELFYRHLSKPHLKADVGLHVTKNYVEPSQRITVGKVGNK